MHTKSVVVLLSIFKQLMLGTTRVGVLLTFNFKYGRTPPVEAAPGFLFILHKP